MAQLESDCRWLACCRPGRPLLPCLLVLHAAASRRPQPFTLVSLTHAWRSGCSERTKQRFFSLPKQRISFHLLQVQTLRKYTKQFEVQGVHPTSSKEDIAKAVSEHWNSVVGAGWLLSGWVGGVPVVGSSCSEGRPVEEGWQCRRAQSEAWSGWLCLTGSLHGGPAALRRHPSSKV